ncbi:MAG: hypothetical protein AMXMBFR34_22950 [Myxococcaceae bacterium]
MASVVATERAETTATPASGAPVVLVTTPRTADSLAVVVGLAVCEVHVTNTNDNAHNDMLRFMVFPPGRPTPHT